MAMDVALLLRQLEFSDFLSRQRMAEAAAGQLGPDLLPALWPALEHPSPAVRLGVIEVLARAGHRASIERLLAHAERRMGDDRVFAIRALAQLGRPEDVVLRAPATAWMKASDPFVQAQGQALARALNLAAKEAAAASPAVPREEDPAGALLAARDDRERMTLIAALEQQGAGELALVARAVLREGNADLVALLCRAMVRATAHLPVDEQRALYPLLEAARGRLAHSAVALDALGDALLALEGTHLSPVLLEHLAGMGQGRLEAALQRLHDRTAESIALSSPLLIQLLQRRPALWPQVGPLLVDAVPFLRDQPRADLRGVCQDQLAQVQRGQGVPAVTLLSLCWLLAELSEAGAPLCRPLRDALARLHLPEAARALAALCARLATDEAARALGDLLRDPLPEARAVAREALRAWRSPWVEVTLGGSEERPALTVRPRSGAVAERPPPALPEVAAPLPIGEPPSPRELSLMATHFRAAMSAIVFLRGETMRERWTGSGIIVGRDGGHVVILTNHHVVAHGDPVDRPRMDAVTVAGELLAVRPLWQGPPDVDLALVEGEVEHPDGLSVAALDAPPADVETPALVIGNPLGQAWRYGMGTVTQRFTGDTREGRRLYYLTTNAPGAPGSSGGGLFHHDDGRLLGVIFAEDRETHDIYAISIDSVRAALAHDGVKWRGRAFP